MRHTFSRAVGVLAVVTLVHPQAAVGQGNRVLLDRGWRIQSSAKVEADGAELSRTGVDTRTWMTATVPTTVVGAQVTAGEFKEPYVGMNLRSIPGTTYPIGAVFARQPMPLESPYRVAWWYRTEFASPADAGARQWLHFDGINYRANVWLNGHQIASTRDIAGAYRRYEFDVTDALRHDGPNALAVEIFAPQENDLGINWVDWNPTPPDKDMGLWRPVYLTSSGPVAVRHPYVLTKLHAPAYDQADLTIIADLWNATDTPQAATLRGTAAGVPFSMPVALAARERKTVRVTPTDVPALHLSSPRLWWPYRMGTPTLYDAHVEAAVAGTVSDSQTLRFGIREVTSELTPDGYRLFKINGKPILIRGGGWSQDMLERPFTSEQLRAHLRYVRDMGLNTIRQEGKLEVDEFYDLADEQGVLVMPGWCCCDQWELWNQWTIENYTVGPDSLRDQLLHLRSHPSIFVWLNGSDKPPIAAIEQKYLDIERDVEWNRPTLSSATEAKGPVSGPTGVKMRGPYEYVPPSYWLTDTKNGGAFGFATEISPGPAVPPIESLEAMLTPSHLWPIDDVWNYHAGGGEFKTVTVFTAALEARYGKAVDAADYARKAQALTYEGERAMFEGYARNKYKSTGVIQWMLNNAWPSIIWHLYDYYMRPGGGYFGTRKACEPIHVQYSYDDHSIAVVNDTQQAAAGITVSASVLDFSLETRFTHEATIDLPADAVARVMTLPTLSNLTTTYFVRLSARDRAGTILSTNFYWLSTNPSVLDESKTQWYYTPVSRHADLTMLATLPATTLRATLQAEASGRATVHIQNTGTALAFQVHLELADAGSREEYLPVYWNDNYFELLPGEARDIAVEWSPRAAGAPVLTFDAWNVRPAQVTSGGR
ncbi:MAG TPA: glycoside hydrolase family 2 protein [Vicinamibacterales bacterium]|nr:glycoside hydrolase family 2 protein [Vicinamibacterales bacterium]